MNNTRLRVLFFQSLFTGEICYPLHIVVLHFVVCHCDT